MDADGIFSLLDPKYGGWGFAALVLAALIFVVRDNLKQRDRLLKWQGDQYQILLGMMEKKIEADLKSESTSLKLRDLLEQQVRKLEWVEKQLNDLTRD